MDFEPIIDRASDGLRDQLYLGLAFREYPTPRQCWALPLRVKLRDWYLLLPVLWRWVVELAGFDWRLLKEDRTLGPLISHRWQRDERVARHRHIG